jgi:hypothetical protein
MGMMALCWLQDRILAEMLGSQIEFNTSYAWRVTPQDHLAFYDYWPYCFPICYCSLLSLGLSLVKITLAGLMISAYASTVSGAAATEVPVFPVLVSEA